jgi:hypothetical protein
MSASSLAARLDGNSAAGNGFLGLGAILIAAGIVVHSYHFVLPGTGITGSYTAPQWHAACTSGEGQVWQGIYQIAHSDCGYVAIADHAIGWLIALGIAAIAAGLVATVIRLARG